MIFSAPLRFLFRFPFRLLAAPVRKGFPSPKSKVDYIIDIYLYIFILYTKCKLYGRVYILCKKNTFHTFVNEQYKRYRNRKVLKNVCTKVTINRTVVTCVCVICVY